MRKSHILVLLFVICGLTLIGCVAEKGTTPAGTFFENFKGLIDNPIVTSVSSVVPGGGIILGSLSAGLGLLAANERRKAKKKDIALDDVVEAAEDLKRHVLPKTLEDWKKENEKTYSPVTLKEVSRRRDRKRKTYEKLVGTGTVSSSPKEQPVPSTTPVEATTIKS